MINTAPVKVEGEHEHLTGQGRLISAAKTRKGPLSQVLTRWDEWRVSYCEINRNQYLPESFRRGGVTLGSILMTLKIKWQGG